MRLFWWEILGFLVVSALGAFFHFTYQLSNENLIVGLFSAIDESILEHVKLALYPSILWIIVGVVAMKESARKILWAFSRSVGLIANLIAIPYLYIAYTSLFEDSLLVDILLFVASAGLGSIVSFQIGRKHRAGLKQQGKKRKQSSYSSIYLTAALLLLPAMFFAITTISERTCYNRLGPVIKAFALDSTLGCKKFIKIYVNFQN